jgi:predicted SprT family Zn-dependent metalloprotease
MCESYEDAVEFIKATHKKYKLKIKAPYQVEFSNRMRSCLGRCREFRLCGKPTKYVFTYNNKYIKANFNNGNVIENTVLHEIAHAIVGAVHHHDNVWRDCAQRIGCDGNRLATGINH